MESSAIYGLESQGRALCSHTSEVEAVRFFVGTLSTRVEGIIHQIDHEEETNKITRRIFKPKVGEIWQIQSCSSRASVLALCYNEITPSTARLNCGLWLLPEDEEEGNTEKSNLKPLIGKFVPSDEELKNQSLRCFDWHSNRPGRFSTILEGAFVIWDVNESNAQVVGSYRHSSKSIYGGKWCPHLDGSQLALLAGSNIECVDSRSMKKAWSAEGAHKFQVRDVDFNPNKQYYMASCGDDCLTKFWDFRNLSEPLKELQSHTHWIWRVRFNAFHDQLVLTAGSDSRVVLHCLPTISSEPKGHAVFSDSEEDDKVVQSHLDEGTLAKYEEHEDAVYAVEWSNYDPWTFASLSYDGRLVINRVPKSQKYKILL